MSFCHKLMMQNEELLYFPSGCPVLVGFMSLHANFFTTLSLWRVVKFLVYIVSAQSKRTLFSIFILNGLRFHRCV